MTANLETRIRETYDAIVLDWKQCADEWNEPFVAEFQLTNVVSYADSAMLFFRDGDAVEDVMNAFINSGMDDITEYEVHPDHANVVIATVH